MGAAVENDGAGGGKADAAGSGPGIAGGGSDTAAARAFANSWGAPWPGTLATGIMDGGASSKKAIAGSGGGWTAGAVNGFGPKRIKSKGGPACGGGAMEGCT